MSAEKLIAEMDGCGIDKALTMPHPPYLREIAPENRYLYDSTRRFPDRILPLGWIDPHLGTDKMRDEIRRCVEEYGFYGVKFNGVQNAFNIDDPVLVMPLVEEVVRLGAVAAFHVGVDGFSTTHPMRFAHIAERFPEARLIMIHMGGLGWLDLSDAAIEVMQAHPNVLGISSFLRPYSTLKALRMLGAARVCFGSDAPFSLMHVELAAYRALVERELSPEDQALYFSGNIVRFLGMQTPA